MLKKLAVTAALVLLLTAAASGAREGDRTLYGAITCYGQPVAGARVTVTGTSTYTTRNVVTNDKGVYVVGKLPMDEYVIRALGPKPGMFKPGHANVMLVKKQREVSLRLKLI